MSLSQVLEDIFVLRAVKGSDFFCIVSGRVDPATIQEVKRSFALRKESRPSVLPSASLQITPSGVVTPANPKQQLLQSKSAGSSSVSSATTTEAGGDGDNVSMESIYAEKDF